MIYKLQKRLIFISLLSILIVIAIIFCSIAALNVSNMNEMMDTLADTIAKNGGDFPEFQGDKPSSPDGKNPDGSALKAPNIITPETRFSTRFFTVTFDKSGSITEIKTDFISAVSEADAIKYAKSAVNSGRARGWEDDYRYGVYSYGETYRVVFVDGAMNKMMASRAILISGAVLIGAAAVVMLLIILLSRRAIKPIAESYEKQKQFITDANHELKTPLTLILANADIAESELGENEWLSDIRSEGKRMTALVNQLVSLSRMDEQQKLDMSEFSLSGAILDTVSEFEGLAKQKNKNIACMVSDGINYKGSEELIRRLASILLDNAVKYCDDGGEISVVLEKRRRITFTVENTYAKVSSVKLDRLFDRFYRADSARTYAGGFGVGLSLAASIVEKHGAQISAYKKDEEHIGFKVVL